MNRAERRTKDRKRTPGARINHTLAVKPLGVKSQKYELNAHFALVALERNEHIEQHLTDLRVLADITEKLSDQWHIKVHADTVRRLMNKALECGRLERLEYVAVETSANILIECFQGAKNPAIARACMEFLK